MERRSRSGSGQAGVTQGQAGVMLAWAHGQASGRGGGSRPLWGGKGDPSWWRRPCCPAQRGTTHRLVDICSVSLEGN